MGSRPGSRSLARRRHHTTLRAALAVVATLLVVTGAPGVDGRSGPVRSAEAQEAGPGPEPVVRQASAADTSPPLRDMQPAPTDISGPLAMRQIPRPKLGGGDAPDPVLDPGPAGPSTMPGPSGTFEGIKNEDNGLFLVLPPDPVGDIGPDHYVQMVNLSFAIYDRLGNLLLGPMPSNTLWQGFPGECGIHNQGDPIVQYDHLADRWLLTQFAFTRDLLATGLPVGPYFQCMAVSATPDPTGPYHRYEFLIDVNKLNDYPKYGVWPDAWYASYNLFDQRELFAFAGAGASAFERDRMLVGDPLARMVFFDYGLVDERFGGQLPTDLEGDALPPPGSPNYFIEADDNTFGFATDRLSIFEFRVNWANPQSSTFTLANSVDVATFDSNLCNYSRNCIPQRSTAVRLDAISDRVMYRAAYRNMGTHEAVVLNHTVDAGDSPDHAAIRWYELRNPGSPSVHQQGTWAPDEGHRWMGSAAMDRFGNIAVGYSLSGTNRFPSLAYAGRRAGDPLGTLAQGERIMFAAGGSQTHSSGRWGDYSSLNLDPLDDCTFWYTQEYYSESSGFGWHTRVGSFVFPDCAAAPVAEDDEATTLENEPVTIDVLANDSDPNGDALSVTAVSTPANGQAVINADGTVTYTPGINFFGIDAFTYTVEDPGGLSDIAVVRVTVTPFCDLVPTGRFLDTLEPGAGPGWQVDTARNDLGVLSPAWQVVTDPQAQSPSHSFFSDATTLDSKDDRLIAPAQGVSATTQLSFWHRFQFESTFDGGVLEVSTDGGKSWVDVVEGGGSFVQGAYNSTISSGFGSPIAGRRAWSGGPVNAAAAAMTRVVVNLGAFEGTGVLVRWRLVADPLVIGSLPGQGWWIDTVELTNTLEVSDCPRPPVARDDEAATQEGTAVNIPVLANDFDPDGDPIRIAAVGPAGNGTAGAEPDGTITYTPDAGFTGTDSFEYTITDDQDGEDTATVTVEVGERPNRNPDAVDDSATTPQDTPVTIAVLANDSDPDGDDLSLTALTQPANGQAAANADGTVTYTPNAGFSGTDAFTYTIEDEHGAPDSATVSVFVIPAPPSGGSATGSGWIPSPGSDGKSNFGFTARTKASAATGRITYDADDEGIMVRGQVTTLRVSGVAADLEGTCSLSDGRACTFRAHVEDHGEPGSGADLFTIRVFDLGGDLIHQAGDVLGAGNIQVR